MTSSYSPYNLASSTGQNLATANSYSGYEAPRTTTFANYQTQPYSTTISSGQFGSPVAGSYESGRNVTYASPAAKVTFGGKTFNQSYTPANYQYTVPAPVQYPTYQSPVEITTQPIRTDVRQETRVEPTRV